MAQPPYVPPQRPVATAGPADLPQHARERLTEMRQSHFFTSDLSVNEFLLVKEVGFDPLGLVMGSSIYHIGFGQVSYSQSAELTHMTQALYHARELAMARMEEEADELGADGIVGVRLEVNLHAWGKNIIEFLAIGTAIRRGDGQQGWRAPGNKPFQSDLSGQDFWTLLRAGYRPLGFVMGNCVYHIASQGMNYQMQQQNMELPQYTQALYDSRELAMERMQYEARELGAEGIVGVVVDESNHTWGYDVIEFSAVGTAVIAISKDHKIPVPSLVLSVND
jgi:uncharacterized protein YbjQ (UPF0145 family)